MIISMKEMKPFVRFAHIFTVNEFLSSPSVLFDGRLFYCISGKGEIVADDQCYTMTKGSMMLINAGTTYQIKNLKATYVGINFDYTFDDSRLEMPIVPYQSEQEFLCNGRPRPSFSDVKELNGTLHLGNMQHLEPDFLYIVGEYTSRRFMFRYEISNKLASVLISVIRELKNPRTAAQTKTAELIIDYIHQNFASALTNEKIGAVFHFHPNYVNRLVKMYTEMTLHQYLLQIRISKAIDLLIANNYSIEQISQMCGFYDTAHFSKSFKRIVSLNPSEFVKNMTN